MDLMHERTLNPSEFEFHGLLNIEGAAGRTSVVFGRQRVTQQSVKVRPQLQLLPLREGLLVGWSKESLLLRLTTSGPDVGFLSGKPPLSS